MAQNYSYSSSSHPTFFVYYGKFFFHIKFPETQDMCSVVHSCWQAAIGHEEKSVLAIKILFHTKTNFFLLLSLMYQFKCHHCLPSLLFNEERKIVFKIPLFCFLLCYFAV